jgi:hypothetical protein
MGEEGHGSNGRQEPNQDFPLPLLFFTSFHRIFSIWNVSSWSQLLNASLSIQSNGTFVVYGYTVNSVFTSSWGVHNSRLQQHQHDQLKYCNTVTSWRNAQIPIAVFHLVEHPQVETHMFQYETF